MGTRLYPVAKIEVLEKLANVPPGTHQKLKEVESKYWNKSIGKDDFYFHIFSDSNINKMHKIMTEGFGKSFTIPEELQECSGYKENPYAGVIRGKENINKVLDASRIALPYNVYVDEIEALNWC